MYHPCKWCKWCTHVCGHGRWYWVGAIYPQRKWCKWCTYLVMMVSGALGRGVVYPQCKWCKLLTYPIYTIYTIYTGGAPLQTYRCVHNFHYLHHLDWGGTPSTLSYTIYTGVIPHYLPFTLFTTEVHIPHPPSSAITCVHYLYLHNLH